MVRSQTLRTHKGNPFTTISTTAHRCGRVRAESSASLPQYYIIPTGPCQEFFCFFSPFFLRQNLNCYFCTKISFFDGVFSTSCVFDENFSRKLSVLDIYKRHRMRYNDKAMEETPVANTVYRHLGTECQSYGTNTHKEAHYAVFFVFCCICRPFGAAFSFYNEVFCKKYWKSTGMCVIILYCIFLSLKGTLPCPSFSKAQPVLPYP